MSPKPLNRTPTRETRAVVLARSLGEPLSDGAVLALLGGIYLGGLTIGVGLLYAVSLLP